MLPTGAKAHLLCYETSGALTGDYTNSVSYLSVAFTGVWPQPEPATPGTSEVALSKEDEQRLLQLARATLSYYFEHRRAPTSEDLGVPITPGMKLVRGAFVTLEEDDELRGCIGEIIAHRPLYQVVKDQALNAGLHDRRFEPVTERELPRLQIEISVLTPSCPVASYHDIEIGKHGMTLEKYGRRAVFLPQVATEQGWDLEETLSNLAIKAGLPPDAWKEGASFAVFEAQVFSEER